LVDIILQIIETYRRREFYMAKKSIRILIADDNRDFCELLKEFINEQEDLNLIGIAYNGLEALQMIQENNPDVVVLDIIMPHLDGIGVLEKYVSGNPGNKPKIIMLTAFGQESVTQRVLPVFR
jgi:two-component system response regulator (stage 0 sporulation protein A)